jgi:hypothetical protein
MISSEDDVRAHVTHPANGKARWIEPGLGSSFGMPDCWVPLQRHCVHIELKCGVIINAVLRYTVRPEQKKQLQILKLDDIPCGLLIGIKHSDLLIAARVDAETLSGALKLEKDSGKWISVVPHSVKGWRETVNFFFGQAK